MSLQPNTGVEQIDNVRGKIHNSRNISKLGGIFWRSKAKVQKCWRVTSTLAEPNQREVQGALKRAFEILGPKQTQTALMQIHADLRNRNGSAAQWLLKYLGQTLTVHQSGVLQHLSPSLRTTLYIIARRKFQPRKA